MLYSNILNLTNEELDIILQAGKSLTDDPATEEEYYSLLRESIAKKVSKKWPEIIQKSLWIRDRATKDITSVPFVFNKAQKSFVKTIEEQLYSKGNKTIEINKTRQEGVTSLLAAFVAVNASVMPNSSFLIYLPNQTMRSEFASTVSGFLLQLLIPAPSIMSLSSAICTEEGNSTIRLFNGSKISYATKLTQTRGRSVDYVIVDELGFVKEKITEDDFLGQLACCLKENGKLIYSI